MDSTNFARNKENRLKELIKDPSRAIALQSAIPSAATSAILKMMRRILGALNVEDQLELSKEMKDLIDNIQQSNYFLFLVLMGRFDLIFEIFQKEGFLKELEEIKELQKKKDDKKFAQNLELLQKNMLSDSNIKKEETYNSPLYNTQMVENHLNVYQYFLLNYREETRRFHKKQIAVYEEDYQARVNLVQRAINILQENEQVPQDEVNHLSELLKNYQNARNSLEQIKIVDENGVINDKKLEEKHLGAANIKLKYSKLIKERLQRYEIYPEIVKTLKEMDENDKKVQSTLMKNEEEYHGNIAKITPHLESSLSLLKQDLSRGIEEVKKELKSINMDNLTEKEKKELQSFIFHLEENEKLISQIKNPLEVDTAIEKIIENIKNFENTHSMSFLKAGKIQNFEMFKSLLNKINQGVNINSFQNESASSLKNNSVFSHQSPIHQNLINIISSEEIQNNIEKTKSFHQEIKEVCENHEAQKSDVLNKDNVLDNDKKEELEELLSSTRSCLNGIDQETLFDENQIQDSLDLCDKIGKNFTSTKLNRLIDLLENLVNNLEDSDEIKGEIDDIYHQLEEFHHNVNNCQNFNI